MTACRCGFDGPEADHPCHACGERPGTRRFYSLGPAALAGHTLKFNAVETWGCDECWALYLAEAKRRKEAK